MTLTFSQILVILAVIGGIVLLVYLTRPRLDKQEQFLLKTIQTQSPQLDNIRLMMCIKTAVRSINKEADLDYQNRFLEDPKLYKSLCEQFDMFGPNAIYPLLGFEALNWHLDPGQENVLVTRLAANQVYRRYPRTAEIIEGLLAHAPDATTEKLIVREKTGMVSLADLQKRYSTELLAILRVITSTPRNEWWPGTNPDIRDWAEGVWGKYEKLRGK